MFFGLSLLLVATASAASAETYISAGFSHSCGLQTDGQVICWGNDEFGQSAVPAGSGPFSQISAGGVHTCALETDGDLICWGVEELGQGGIPAGSGPFSQISVGDFHTCALETDGDVICWGDDRRSQVSAIPPNGGPFSQVSAGHFHSCAIDTDGDVHCWGRDVFDPSFLRPAPYSQISVGGAQVRGSARSVGKDEWRGRLLGSAPNKRYANPNGYWSC
ncbi:hypothetical protein KFU94_36685 [Chloroflexi bacterium TSY]|nr:hypothetical protein [Chloroflexi bacterium TSY]